MWENTVRWCTTIMLDIWGIRTSFHQGHQVLHLIFWLVGFDEFQKDLSFLLCLDFGELVIALKPGFLVLVHPCHAWSLFTEVIFFCSYYASLFDVHDLPSVPILYKCLVIIYFLHNFFCINLCHIWSRWTLRWCVSLIGRPYACVWVRIFLVELVALPMVLALEEFLALGVLPTLLLGVALLWGLTLVPGLALHNSL